MPSLAVIAGVLLSGAVLAGCYTLQPASGGAPVVGTKVAFDVNDAGRVALGGPLGPEVTQIEGQLVQQDSSGYLLAVSAIRTLRGGEQVWAGEQVRVRPEYLGNTYERRFSLGRSIGLGVVGAGGLAAIIASRSLLGLSTKGDDPIDDTVNTRLGRP